MTNNNNYIKETIVRITTHDLKNCLKNQEAYEQILLIILANYSIMESFSTYVEQLEESLPKRRKSL